MGLIRREELKYGEIKSIGRTILEMSSMEIKKKLSPEYFNWWKRKWLVLNNLENINLRKKQNLNC